MLRPVKSFAQLTKIFPTRTPDNSGFSGRQNRHCQGDRSDTTQSFSIDFLGKRIWFKLAMHCSTKRMEGERLERGLISPSLRNSLSLQDNRLSARCSEILCASGIRSMPERVLDCRLSRSEVASLLLVSRAILPGWWPSRPTPTLACSGRRDSVQGAAVLCSISRYCRLRCAD